ncbi:MAG: hypothetical protein [Microviridae sp.]|nr:MAG: hypothetical protein [Microviridae sp.]
MTTLVKTRYNRELHPCNYEVNDQPSETVPDQTMSIRTILDRYARGLPTAGQSEALWQDDDEYNDLPDHRTLDLSERQELAIQAKQELEELKKVINSKKYPKKTQGVQGTVVPATLPEKGADGTEAEKQGNEIA